MINYKEWQHYYSQYTSVPCKWDNGHFLKLVVASHNTQDLAKGIIICSPKWQHKQGFMVISNPSFGSCFSYSGDFDCHFIQPHTHLWNSLSIHETIPTKKIF